MSPLRWMQSTDPHWRVILEEFTSVTLTEVGAADGAVLIIIIIGKQKLLWLMSGVDKPSYI